MPETEYGLMVTSQIVESTGDFGLNILKCRITSVCVWVCWLSPCGHGVYVCVCMCVFVCVCVYVCMSVCVCVCV